jgi:hypothetical protein
MSSSPRRRRVNIGTLHRVVETELRQFGVITRPNRRFGESDRYIVLKDGRKRFTKKFEVGDAAEHKIKWSRRSGQYIFNGCEMNELVDVGEFEEEEGEEEEEEENVNQTTNHPMIIDLTTTQTDETTHSRQSTRQEIEMVLAKNLENVTKSREVECSVCMTNLPEMGLNCDHMFCVVCLQRLYEREDNDPQCPQCRTLITSIHRMHL